MTDYKVGKPHFYVALEGLRGLAAILIAIRHNPLSPVSIIHSYLAVDLFFLLSGFVIASSYERKLSSGDISAKNFIVSRIIRLYPLYFIGTVFGVIYAYQFETIPIHTLLASLPLALFNLPNLLKNVGPFPFNLPAWSLFFEFLASIVYGLWLYRQSNRKIALVTLFAAAGFVFGVMVYGNGNFGYQRHGLGLGLFRIAMSFGLGVLIYRYRERLSGLIPGVSGNLGTLLVYSAAIAMMSMPVPEYGPVAALYVIAVTCLIFPIIFVVALDNAPTGWLKSVSLVLGMISYPLYAIHSSVYSLFTGFADSLAPRAARMLLLESAVTLSLCVLLAWLLNRYFDMPARAMLTRWWKSLPGKAMVPEAAAIAINDTDEATEAGAVTA